MLSYRKFMGDYLDLNGDSALGGELKSACGLGGASGISNVDGNGTKSPLAESVAFSSRIQLLVSKFGRSSKPCPRHLVVVSRSVISDFGFF